MDRNIHDIFVTLKLVFIKTVIVGIFMFFNSCYAGDLTRSLRNPLIFVIMETRLEEAGFIAIYSSGHSLMLNVQ